jgi:hypothetical protein
MTSDADLLPSIEASKPDSDGSGGSPPRVSRIMEILTVDWGFVRGPVLANWPLCSQDDLLDS